MLSNDCLNKIISTKMSVQRQQPDFVQERTLNMPLSPAANRRRAALNGKADKSPMELLLKNVPPDETNVQSSKIFTRATEGDDQCKSAETG